MLNFSGQIAKLQSQLTSPISYMLPIGDSLININNYLNHKLSIKFNGDIFCIGCWEEKSSDLSSDYHE